MQSCLNTYRRISVMRFNHVMHVNELFDKSE
jgi:hypothetical protein